MTEDKQIMDAWYQHAAGVDGFLGAVLRRQRAKAFLTQEQQRAMLGILDRTYDHLWLHLQAMPLPRTDQFTTDLERMVEKVLGDEGREVNSERKQLEELIRAGLEEDSSCEAPSGKGQHSSAKKSWLES